MESVTQESNRLKSKVRNLASFEFNEVALDIFRLQARHCKVYSDFLYNIGVAADSVRYVDEIPCLPISAFKGHVVKTGTWQEEMIFTSSSTTGTTPSNHYVHNAKWYELISLDCFNKFYNEISDYSFYCLLPSYLERSGSSLVYMADYFMRSSGNDGGFYLYDHYQLLEDLKSKAGKKILLGVSYALLDLAEDIDGKIDDLIVMETGGMKGRKTEINRAELHLILKQKFGVQTIHSEYGMTELFSQAYSGGDGIFMPGSTMKVSTVQVNDPLSLESFGKSGIMRIIDLANIDTCSFILTDDLGIVDQDGSFQVIGRADHSEIRGCNLMVSDL